MNARPGHIEAKLSRFIVTYPEEWNIVCGLKPGMYREMGRILPLLRDSGLYELEAMLVWRMEYWEMEQD